MSPRNCLAALVYDGGNTRLAVPIRRFNLDNYGSALSQLPEGRLLRAQAKWNFTDRIIPTIGHQYRPIFKSPYADYHLAKLFAAPKDGNVDTFGATDTHRPEID